MDSHAQLALPGEVHRVLVVDDHPDTTGVLSVMFHMLGYETRSALRGRDALRLAREFDPELIMLDIGLPDINGYEVVHALRANARIARRYIVALTGWSRPEDVARSMKAGFDEHLQKPIDLAKVRQILRTAGDRARSREARVACGSARREADITLSSDLGAPTCRARTRAVRIRPQ